MACVINVGGKSIEYDHFIDLFDKLDDKEIVEIFKFQADIFNQLLILKKDPKANADKIAELNELNYFNSNNIYEANGISAILKSLDKEYNGRLSYLESEIKKTDISDVVKLTDLYDQYKSLERDFDKQQVPRTVKKISNAIGIKSDYDFSRATGLITTNTGKVKNGLTDEQYFLINVNEPLVVRGTIDKRVPLTEQELAKLAKKLQLILRLSKGFPPSNIKALNKISEGLDARVNEELHTKLMAIQISDEDAVMNNGKYELTEKQEKIYHNLIKFSNVRFTIHSKKDTGRMYGFISKPLSSSGGNNLTKAIESNGANIEIIKQYYKVYEHLYNNLDFNKIKDKSLELEEQGNFDPVVLDVMDISPTSVSRVFPYKDANTGIPATIKEQYGQYTPTIVFPFVTNADGVESVDHKVIMASSLVNPSKEELNNVLKRKLETDSKAAAYLVGKRFSKESNDSGSNRVELTKLSSPKLYDNKEKVATLIYHILTEDYNSINSKLFYGTNISKLTSFEGVGTLTLPYLDKDNKEKTITFKTSDSGFSVTSIADKLEELKDSNAVVNFVDMSLFTPEVQSQLKDIYFNIQTLNNTFIHEGKAYFAKNTLFKFTSDSLEGLNNDDLVLVDNGEVKPIEEVEEDDILYTIEPSEDITPEELKQLKDSVNISNATKTHVGGHLFNFILNTSGNYQERLADTMRELDTLANTAYTEFNDVNHRYFEFNALNRDDIKTELISSLEERLTRIGLLNGKELTSIDIFDEDDDQDSMETQQYNEGYQLTLNLKTKLPAAIRNLIASLKETKDKPDTNSFVTPSILIKEGDRTYFRLNRPVDYNTVFSKLLNALTQLELGDNSLTGGNFNALNYMLSAMAGRNIDPTDPFLNSIEKWDTPDSDIRNVAKTLLELPAETRTQVQTAFFVTFSKFKIEYLNTQIKEFGIEEGKDDAGKPINKTLINVKNTNPADTKRVGQHSSDFVSFLESKYYITVDGKSVLSPNLESNLDSLTTYIKDNIEPKLGRVDVKAEINHVILKLKEDFGFNIQPGLISKFLDKQFLFTNTLKVFISKYSAKPGSLEAQKDLTGTANKLFREFINDLDSTVTSVYVDGKNYFSATNASFLHRLFKQLQDPNAQDSELWGWKRKASFIYQLGKLATLNIGLSVTRNNKTGAKVNEKLFRDSSPLEGKLIRLYKFLNNGYEPIMYPDTTSDASTELNIKLGGTVAAMNQDYNGSAYKNSLLSAINAEIKTIFLIQKQSLDPNVQKVTGVHNNGELKGNGNFFVSFPQLNKLVLEKVYSVWSVAPTLKEGETEAENTKTVRENAANRVKYIIDNLFGADDQINPNLFVDGEIVLPEELATKIKDYYLGIIVRSELGKGDAVVNKIVNSFLEYKSEKQSEQDYFRSLIPDDILNPKHKSTVRPRIQVVLDKVADKKDYKKIFTEIYKDFLMKQYIFSAHYKMFVGDNIYSKAKAEKITTVEQLAKKLNTINIDTGKRQKRYISAHQNQLWNNRFTNAFTFGDISVEPSTSFLADYGISEDDIRSADATDGATAITVRFSLDKKLSSGEIPFYEFMHHWAKHDIKDFTKNYKDYSTHPDWQLQKGVSINTNGKVLNFNLDDLFKADSDFTINDLVNANFKSMTFGITKPLSTWSQKGADDLRIEGFDKNSEYVILPNTLDKNSWLAKVHEAMVDKKAAMFYFPTARKLAGSKDFTSIKDFLDGKEPVTSKVDLAHYGMQVVVPIKDKDESTMGTQAMSLAIGDLDPGDIVGYEDGKFVTAQTLIESQYQSLSDLLDYNLEQLEDKIGINKDGNIVNFSKVTDLLRRTLDSLGYNKEDIDNTLKTVNGQYNTPVSFSNLRPQIIKIIKKEFTNLLRQKTAGASYVLAPEEFLKTDPYKIKRAENTVPTSVKNSVVWTSKEEKERFEKYNGLSYFEVSRKEGVTSDKEYTNKEIADIFTQYDKLETLGLEERRRVESVILPKVKEIYTLYNLELPRVILPMFLKVNGEVINVKNYVNKEGFLDTDRIPEEALTIFGFRIPYQSKGSGVGMKIAGFLPYEQKDTIFVSQEIIPQTGTDFDVDKFFVYFKNTTTTTLLDESGDKVKLKVNNEGKAKHQNNLLDIYLKSFNFTTIKDIVQPLGNDDFAKAVEEVSALVTENQPLNVLDLVRDTNSAHYQNELYENNSFGKTALGIFVAGSIMYEFIRRSSPELASKSVMIDGKPISYSGKYTLDGSIKKSKQFMQAINVAVDIAKMGSILKDSGVNIDNVNYVTTMMSMGLTFKQIFSIINSNAFKSYIASITSKKTILGYQGRKEDLMALSIEEEFNDLEEKNRAQFYFKKNNYADSLTWNKFFDISIDTDFSKLDLYTQREDLYKFFFFVTKNTQKISQYSTAYKNYRKGLPSTPIEIIQTKNKIDKLNKSDRDNKIGIPFKLGNNFPVMYQKVYGKAMNALTDLFPEYEVLIPKLLEKFENNSSIEDKELTADTAMKLEEDLIKYFSSGIIDSDTFTNLINIKFKGKTENFKYSDYPRIALRRAVDLVNSLKQRPNIDKSFISKLITEREYTLNQEDVAKYNIKYKKNEELNHDYQVQLYDYLTNPVYDQPENREYKELAQLLVILNYSIYSDTYSTANIKDLINSKTRDLIAYPQYAQSMYPVLTNGQLTNDMLFQLYMNNIGLWDVTSIKSNDAYLENKEIDDYSNSELSKELKKLKIFHRFLPESTKKFISAGGKYYIRSENVYGLGAKTNLYIAVEPNNGRLVSKIKYDGIFNDQTSPNEIDGKREMKIRELLFSNKGVNVSSTPNVDITEFTKNTSEEKKSIELTGLDLVKKEFESAPEHSKIFLDVFGDSLRDISIEYGTSNSFIPNQNKITVIKGSSYVAIQHELIHALTMNNLSSWYNDPNTRGTVDNILNSLTMLSDKLGPIRDKLNEVKKLIDEAKKQKTNIRNVTNDFISNTPEFKKFFEDKGIDVAGKDLTTTIYSLSFLSNPEKLNFIGEEVAEGLAALSDPLFQELTNKIEYKDSNLFQFLIEKLRNLINSLVSHLGVKANENTVLINLLSDMYSLVDKEKLTEVKEDDIKPLNTLEPISIVKLENKFKLRNPDGSAKKYLDYEVLKKKVIKLNKQNPEFKFRIFDAESIGEISDGKKYYSVSVEQRISNQTNSKDLLLNKIKDLNPLNESNSNEREYSSKHGRFGKLVITGSEYKFLPTEQSPFSISTNKQGSIFSQSNNDSRQNKSTNEAQKMEFAKRVFDKLLYSESWDARAYREITRVFTKTSLVFVDQPSLGNVFTTTKNNIVVNLNDFNSYSDLSDNQLDILLSEEVIHLVHANIISDDENKFVLESLSDKDRVKINNYYHSRTKTKIEDTTLTDYSLVQEYIRMAVQNYLFSKTSEDEMLNKIKLTVPSLYLKLVTVLSKIKQFILQKANNDIFTSNIVNRITELENYQNYTNDNNQTVLPSNGQTITNDLKIPQTTKVNNFVYKSNPEINPYKFDLSKGGYSDVVSRLKSRLITLGIINKNMMIQDEAMFNKLQESWTNQAEKLYSLEGIPKVMINIDGVVKFRDTIFHEIDFENGVVTPENKYVAEKVQLKEAGISDINIQRYFSDYFNKPRTYEDGSKSEPLNVEFTPVSFIDFINKRQGIKLDGNAFNTTAEYTDEINRLALQPDEVIVEQMSDEEIEELNMTCGLKLAKAANGANFGFKPGGKWEVIKDFKGPSHAQGGIDIKVDSKGVKIINKNGLVKAEYGMVIPKK